MQTMVQANQTSNALLWVGRVMSGLVIAFMLFDGVMNRRNPANWLFGWGNCFRLNDPIFTHTLFGLYLGLLVWGGLAGSPGRDRDHLRDARLRALIPLRVP
jgi:hypothetical protein